MFNGTVREIKKEDAAAVEGMYDLYWSGGFRENLSKRLVGFVSQDADLLKQGFQYFVAEGNDEVVGVIAFRKSPLRMKEYSKTDDPAELYILAVKYKRHGIGRMLVSRLIKEVTELGYTEVVLFSGETHDESWGFYDRLDFTRVGPAVAPNGEAGMIWKMEIN